MIAFHEKNEALATIALCAVENPLEFGIVITREDGTHRALLGEAGLGPGLQRHHQHRASTCSSPRSSTASPRAARSTSPARCSRPSLEAGQPLYGYVADGYWEDVGHDGRLSQGARGHPRRQGRGRRVGLRAAPGRLDRQGLVHRPARSASTSPAFIGENCTIDGTSVLGAYTTLGANTQVAERGRDRSAPSSARTPTWARRRGSRARCWGARATCGSGARDRARGGGRGGLPGRRPRRGAERREGLPVQGGRGGAPRSTPPSCGSPAGRAPCSGREGVQGIANVDVSPELAVRLAKAWASGFEKGSYITASRDTSRVARVLKRALMVGCNSVGRQRQRPGAGHRARDAAPRAHAAATGPASRCA